MNVDVLNRSGAQPPAAVEARDRRLRHASARRRRRHRRGQQGAVSVPVAALAGARRDHSASSYRQPWEKGSAYPKGQPQACRRDAGRTAASRAAICGFMAAAAPGPEQRGARHPESADQRARARRTPICRPR